MRLTKTRLRRILGKLALLLVPLVFMFIILEIVLRISGPDEQPVEPVQQEEALLRCLPDSQFGWIFPPGARGDFDCGGYLTPVEANDQGIRNRTLDPDARGKRILVLGDSYTFGWGVEEEAAFPRRLEAIVSERFPDLPVEVINTGIPGYCPTQQRIMLSEICSVVPIDFVVSVFSVANDPVDELRLARYLPDRLLEYSYEVREASSFSARLIRSSRVLTLLDEKTLNVQYSLANTGPKAIGLTRRAVDGLVSDCRDRSLPLLLVVVPRAAEVQDCGRARKLFNFTAKRVRGLVREIAEDRGVPLLDLRQSLDDANREGDIYLENDAHWNADGHRVVAEILADAISGSWFEAE